MTHTLVCKRCGEHVQAVDRDGYCFFDCDPREVEGDHAMTKTPYERSRDAAVTLINAASAYAEALYEHDTRVRGITPYGSYKDVMDALKAVLANAENVARDNLQTTMTVTR